MLLTLDQVSVGQWCSLFQLPQNSNTTPMSTQMGANAFSI